MQTQRDRGAGGVLLDALLGAGEKIDKFFVGSKGQERRLESRRAAAAASAAAASAAPAPVSQNAPVEQGPVGLDALPDERGVYRAFRGDGSGAIASNVPGSGGIDVLADDYSRGGPADRDYNMRGPSFNQRVQARQIQYGTRAARNYEEKVAKLEHDIARAGPYNTKAARHAERQLASLQSKREREIQREERKVATRMDNANRELDRNRDITVAKLKRGGMSPEEAVEAEGWASSLAGDLVEAGLVQSASMAQKEGLAIFQNGAMRSAWEQALALGTPLDFMWENRRKLKRFAEQNPDADFSDKAVLREAFGVKKQ